MKNMDYEKKYNEALDWMRELYPGLHGATKEDAEHYFPELKESEESKDERIRKAIVELIKRTPSSMFDADTVGKWIGASHDEILAYLEKQKEQKESGIKWFKTDNLKNPDKPYIDKAGMFYTTDGRMCYASEIEKQKEQKSITINQDEKEFLADEITAFLCNYDKEFDGEDPVPSEVAEHFYLLGKQAQEQNPVEWSEEDKETIDLTIAVLRENIPNSYFKTNPANTLNMGAISTDQLINRLKSLKDRGNFPKSNTNSPNEWSEEDKNKLYRVMETLLGDKEAARHETPQHYDVLCKAYDELIDFLKYLPERFNLHPQAKHEQKEQKDEMELGFIEGKVEGIRQTCQDIKDAMSLYEPKHLTAFESTFRDYINSAIRYCLSGEGYQQYIKEWSVDLLNLEKHKKQKPKAGKASSWKPSEEQMEALSETIAFAPDTFKPKCTLVTLQDDLKKLMEN